MTNHWLDPIIKNYLFYFGETDKPVVWEVGSRDGRDAVELAERIYKGNPAWFWDNARVVAFEPNPAQAEIIKAEYPEIELHQIAATNVKGSAPFMVYAGDEGAIGSSSLNLEWKGDEYPKTQIIVETDRLENLMGDEKIDIMKIDVEGFSLEVLEGMGDKLRQVKAFHIETEVWTNSNVKVKAFMLPRGYIMVDDTEQYGGMPDQVWIRQ